MSWAAANVPRRQSDKESGSASKPKTQRKTETVEAALNRLSNAYALSMECVGAMHQANAAILKRQGEGFNEDESFVTLKKVATAARDTLEKAVLLDPLIVAHSPTLRDTIRKFADRDGETNQRWVFLCKPRPDPPKISSKAHRSTIRQLAYLAMINYSDLLVSVCTCECTRPGHAAKRRTILDRGVVKKLSGFKEFFSTNGCCWADDSEEDIQRIALVSLCDATLLDGSDPVVWLKLACAARAMGHIKTLPNPLEYPILSPFRRLERHALESGYTALPPNLPPNRAIKMSLDQFNNDELPESYPSILSQTPEACKISVDMTRYSWSLLGRLLVRAFRDGSDVANNDITHIIESSQQRSQAVPFGSPIISLKISPMLLLPSYVLGKLITYLENEAVCSLEATCRSLSVSIMAVRAAQEKRGGNIEEKESPVVDAPMDVSINTGEERNDDANVAADGEHKEEDGEPAGESSSAPTEEPTRISRSSKRVRSQQMTSDKREERLRKRKSVGFCLRAAILSCTAENAMFKSSLNEPNSWNQIMGQTWQLPASSAESRNTSAGKGKTTPTEGSRRQFEALERISTSSLSSFLKRVSSQNSNPADLILGYLRHVSRHVEEVFAVDPGDAMILSASVLTGFELVLKSKFRNMIVPHFSNYGDGFSAHDIEQALELFAMDILNVELRFKGCERYKQFNVAFEDNPNYVCCMIPELLDGIKRLDEMCHGTDKQREWTKLKARAYWLVSGVYLWRSLFTRSVFESIEAEEQGLKYIGATIDCLALPLNDPVERVATPHLESPGRAGAHWKRLCKDALSTYRDEIEASSVVSHAQQQFQERVVKVVKRIQDDEDPKLEAEDIRALSKIGETLSARYLTPFNGENCKHAELLDNFMSVHGDDFAMPKDVNHDVGGEGIHYDESIAAGGLDVKVFKRMTNPSILTILTTCLHVEIDTRISVSELLIRLVLTALDRHEHLSRTGAAEKNQEGRSPENFTDSDDSDSVDDEIETQEKKSDHMGPRSGALQCGRLITFMLEKVHKAILSLPVEEKTNVISSGEFSKMVHHSLAFCSCWFDNFTQQPSAVEEAIDLKVFIGVRELLHSLLGLPDCGSINALNRLFFSGLVRIVSSQRVLLDAVVRVQGTIRARRAVRQRICILRAEFIGTIFCEIANLLSRNLFVAESGKIVRAELTSFSTPDQAEQTTASTTIALPPKLAVLCEALLWFGQYTTISSQSDAEALSSFDRPIVDRLKVPLAAAIISLCGSGACTRSSIDPSHAAVDPDHGSGSHDNTTDRLSLSEFLDSDASAREFSENEEGKEESSQDTRKELLRVLCHVVHCVGLVFRKVDEKEIVSFDTNAFYLTRHGPLLPLVVARVLNHVADTLLREFEEEECNGATKGVWAREYPFGTCRIGALLDASLYKAYKCLHGFTLVGANDQYLSKDQIPNITVEAEKAKYAPENHRAAAQLYRCIVRCGKKTPSKAALEAVSSALPPLQENEKSKMIKEFLYSARRKSFEVADVISIVTKTPKWKRNYEVIKLWKNANEFNSNFENESQSDPLDDEVTLVRKGIFAQLAQGDLPAFSNEVDGKENDRAGAARFEEDLWKKFSAILNTLCYGETYDIRGWFRAAQCLMLKAELVADRLGLCKGFSRNQNFFIPRERPPAVPRLSVAALEEKQEQETVVKSLGWTYFLGDDLSLYIKHKWSCLTSLRALSDQLLKDATPATTPSAPKEGDMDDFAFRVRKEIEALQEKKRFGEWQQAWGGMFVSGIREVAMRCSSVAMFIYHEYSSVIKKEDLALMPELHEFLGTTLYSGMIGSQNYGYPMHVMTLHQKRQVANASRICFQRAVDVARTGSERDVDADTETWDLDFMIGKCHEKIASTYKLESFPVSSQENDSPRNQRQFGLHMKEALACYRSALDEKSDKEHREAGGSSHGGTEVFYRLHASRLKCLLVAAEANEEERSFAEEEALRLTENHWYGDNSQSSEATNVRERVWRVLADVVSALAQCRLEHSFFHRSVYRHAQALMWAPVLCDPVAGRNSKSTVPATKSCHLRGLNHATNAAQSALAVMSTLFEKKRTQLVAVWVTTTYPPTAFETLNNSVRKYDSLRGKYISAYIDGLRLCGNRNELETLLRWIANSKRDLPSLFSATTMAEGGRPEKSHNQDSLLVKRRSLNSYHVLTGLKRQANSAMAAVLNEEFKDSNVRSIENHLRLAYACFLRLNCSVQEVKKTRVWRYGPGGFSEVEALCQAFLKLDGEAEIKIDPNDWSGGGQKAAVLDAAIQKCRELFPSLSGSYYSKKTNQKFKGQNESESKDGGDERDMTQQFGKKRSFEVEVPEGLTEGQTFTTTITEHERAKKVKLTVPAGNPRMLRFSLDLSTQAHD